MNKNEFFKQLHQQLEKKYNLTSSQVATLRGFLHTKTRKEIGEWIALKLSEPHKERRHSKEHYQELLNFVASCSEEAWKEITQITKFDKEGVIE